MRHIFRDTYRCDDCKSLINDSSAHKICGIIIKGDIFTADAEKELLFNNSNFPEAKNEFINVGDIKETHLCINCIFKMLKLAMPIDQEDEDQFSEDTGIDLSDDSFEDEHLLLEDECNEELEKSITKKKKVFYIIAKQKGKPTLFWSPEDDEWTKDKLCIMRYKSYRRAQKDFDAIGINIPSGYCMEIIQEYS